MNSRLLDARKRAGLTQMGLAALSGISSNRLCLWELGASRPNQRNALKLAKALAVAVETIFPNFNQLRKF